MAGFRMMRLVALSFGLILAVASAGYSQVSSAPPTAAGQVAAPSGAVNKVYSLAELGDDPSLCKWIADTIP